MLLENFERAKQIVLEIENKKNGIESLNEAKESFVVGEGSIGIYIYLYDLAISQLVADVADLELEFSKL